MTRHIPSWFLLLAMLLPIGLQAQNYFNRFYKQNTIQSSLGTVVAISDSEYVAVGKDFTIGGLLFFKVNHNGDSMIQKVISDSLHYYYPGTGRFLQKFEGKNIVIGGAINDTAGISRALLVVYDSLGDTILSRSFGFGIEDIGYCARQTKDSGFVLTGTHYPSANVKDILLIKCDAGGNLEWWKKYSNSGRISGLNVEECSDGGFIIGGIYRFTSGESRPYVLRTDSTGNLEWQKSYGSIENNGGCFAIQLSDGNYLLSGANDYGDGKDLQAVLWKVDSDGKIIWERASGSKLTDYNQTSAIELEDGSIVAGGMTAGLKAAWLIKYSANGDSLWKHEYFGPFGISGLIDMYGFDVLPNGGFIICGTGAGIQGDIDGWLLKVDSFGCPVMDCQLVWRENDASTDRIGVYPNPATEYLNIVMPGNAAGDFQLYDVNGILVKKTVIHSAHIEITIMDLQMGMYFWRFTGDDGRKATGKLSVVK